MELKYTILELPKNNQIVQGRLQRYNGIELQLTYLAEEQEFLIMESGLRIKAIEVESWYKIN